MKLQEAHDGGGGGGDEDDLLLRSRHLLSSLSESVPAVRCLRGRWSAVSTTLDRLSAALDGLSGLPAAASHPLSGDLLRSLPPALSSALSLSLSCAFPDPPAGKLRTQSDLAAAAASLDQLASDADLLLRSGVLLLDPAPLPLSHFRSQARSLITRLQIGGPAARAAALDTLAAVLREDDKNVVIAAAQGVVPALVRLLDSPCRETKHKAVAAVATIAAVESCRHVLAAEGAALSSNLARVLESDDGFSATAEEACLSLQALTLTRDNAMAIGTRGCIPSLIRICQNGTPPSQAAAAGVLKNLAGVQELRRLFLEDNAIPVLKRVLSCGTVLAQENSMGCLHNLAADDEGQTLKLTIIKEGGLDCIKNYWESGEVRNLEPAIRLLRKLSSFYYIADIIVSSGFLQLAVSALGSAASTVRTEAAVLISELAPVGKGRKEAGEFGCVHSLVVMLGAKAVEEKKAAAMALASLMSCNANRRLFRKEEKGVGNVVLLLDPRLRGVDKSYPVSVLLSVSQSSRCRKQMTEAGAHGYVQRLVDEDVEGAKKLLEILGRGKLWGVFPRV